jgi:toxin ParE1/3/4
MTHVSYSNKARDDLHEIRAFIAADSVDMADKFVDRIEEKCHLLATTPKIGRARFDIADGLRVFPLGGYVIVYQEAAYGIHVLRVIHAARDFPTFFHRQDM